MKLSVFSPYGSFHRESGLLYLVANYLDKQGADVLQLRCDGALPACGRDKKYSTGRTPFSCLQCSGEQSALAQWAGVRSRVVSAALTPEDVLESAKWISAVSSKELDRLEFRGVRLWEVCRREVLERWDVETVAALSAAQERDLRNLYLSYVHTVVSSERFITTWKPTLSFVPMSQDVLSNAYLSQVRRLGGEAALFSYLPEEESILVESLSNGSQYKTTLILPDIIQMRSDPRTWAPELSAIVNEMLSFLGHGADLIPEQR